MAQRTQKQIDHNRAFGLRGKLERNAEVSADDRAWFEGYAKEHPNMAPRAKVAPAPAGEASEPAKVPEPEAAAPGQGVPPPKAPPIPKAPPPPKAKIPSAPKAPPPPKFEVHDSAPKSAKNANGPGRWQDKYVPKTEGGDQLNPREYICLQGAQIWFSFLAAGAELLVAIGKKPAFDPEDIKGPIVLAVDMMLPENIDFSPEKLAVAATGVLLGQCALNYRAIKAEVKARQSRATHEDEIAKMRAKAEAQQAAQRAANEARTKAAQREAEIVVEVEEPDAPSEHEDLLDPVVPAAVANYFALPEGDDPANLAI